MRILAQLVLMLVAFVPVVSAQQVQGGGRLGAGENVAPAFVPNNPAGNATDATAETAGDSALAAPSGYHGAPTRALGSDDLHKNGGRDMWSCSSSNEDWSGCANHAGQNSYSGGTAPNRSNFGGLPGAISGPQAP